MSCATPPAGCCGRSTAASAKLGAYLEDHAYLLEAYLTVVRGDLRRGSGSPVRVELADTDPRALPRPVAGRLLLGRRRPHRPDRPPQGPRGRPDPLGRLRRGLRPAAAGTDDGRGPLRGRRPVPDPVAARDRFRSTRWPSATCCARSTSRLCPRPTRSRWPATDVAELARGRGRGGYWPYTVLAGGVGPRPAVRGPGFRSTGRPAAYVCRNFTCRLPVTSAEELTKLLEQEAPPRRSTSSLAPG